MQRIALIMATVWFSVSGIALAAPGIVVTGVADGGTHAFGNVQVGSSETMTFTVTNNGDAALTFSGVNVTGPEAGQFTFTSPSGPVAVNGTATFTVTFTPTSTGNKSAALTLGNNAPGALSPYNISLTGTGTQPDIVISEVSDGGNFSFGNMQWGGSPVVRTFNVTNTGTAPLVLQAPTINGPNASEFSVTTPSGPVPPGGATSFSVTYTASSRGNKNADLSLGNNAPGSKSPYNFAITATATAPVMTVAAGAAIADDGELDLGPVSAGLTEKRTFVIRNTGDATLSGLTISKSGANASEYSVSHTNLPSVPVNGTANFEVIFAPPTTVSGVRTAQLVIASNDPATNPYTINLKATVAAKIATEDTYGYKINTVPRDLVTLKDTDADVVSAVALIGDDVSQSVNLGFSFNFYDKAYTSCEASTNGLLVFGGGSGATSYSPTPAGSTNAPTNFIAPFWTDLFRTNESKILYATRGQAPNRVFIMQYENMRQYNNTGNSVTFLVKLYEGTNTIEFQYRDISSGWASTGMNFFNGIRSRNYPSDPADAGYVPTLSGIYGFQDKYGPMNAGNLPSFPSAIAFTRPITIKVESAYSRDGSDNLTNVGSIALGLNPSFGTTIRGNNYGDVKEFKAPAEIYLNKDFDELPAAGEIDAANPAWYRLVNDGYSVDGQQVQGANTFFTKTLTQDLKVVWRWRLECAVIVESATGQGGFGNPTPAVGRYWYAPGSQFIASIDSNIVNNDGGYRFNTVGYSLKNKNGQFLATQPPPFALDNSPRRNTAPITITDPLHLTWNFTGQVRYRFDAYSAVLNGGSLDGHAFIRVYAADRTTVESTYWNSGANTEVWVESGLTAGRKVEIGSFYRTKDRTLTLGDFSVPVGGDLGNLGSSVATLIDENTADQLGDTRVARVYTVTNAINPTDVHWLFRPTVYRSVVELGRGLDLDEDGNVPNNQLLPSMPVGSLLQVTGTGPGNSVTTRIAPPDGSFQNGDPLKWDMNAKNLLPVRPGAYEISWPDANDPEKSFLVEVLSGYPGDTVRRTTAAEDVNGFRTRLDTLNLTSCQTVASSNQVVCNSTLGLIAGMTVHGQNIPTGSTVTEISNGNTFRISNPASASGSGFGLAAWRYDMTIVMPTINVTDGYPAQAENAHYRHMYDSIPSRQIPTKLDLDPADTWKFQDLTYADQSTSAAVAKNDPGVPFTATGPGRSVLLFSTRANPDEIADGNLSLENYVVRVVRSSAVNVIPRTDPRLVLGANAMQLGGGSYGITQTGGAPATSAITLGENFVMDFWLNAKDLIAPAAQSLTNCATTATGTLVTCDSTAGLLPGMLITGTNISAQTRVVSIINGTTFVISNPATATGSGLTFSATNKQITLISTGNAGLTVTIDEAAATITLNYRGAKVVQPLSKAGMSWRHYAVHVFTNNFFGVDVTVADFYLDGIRQEQGFVTEWFPGNADSSVGNSVTPASLRFGVDAESRSALKLDNFRLFNLGSDNLGYLSASELLRLRNVRDMTVPANYLRGVGPLLSFTFETAPVGSFLNQGSLPNLALGPITGSLDSVWPNINYQEVASRLEITLDNAGFNGSGYVLNEVSNYNNRLYTRSAEVGQWGPVYPVNNSVLFTESLKKLEVAYYENPYRIDRIPHPNVAWPYIATEFNNVVFPTVGPDKDKAIYIASRIGSEGISKTGRPQAVYNLDTYSDFSIYYQNDVNAGGYNPNEEHAIAAPSGRAAVKVKNAGEALANNPPLAAFALQNGINNKVTYTSDPWVLIQVKNIITGEPEMAAYQVFQTRTGAMPFPRPLDSQVGGTTGLAYEPAATPEARFLTLAADTSFDFNYQFEYPVFAGDLLVPPYPVNLAIGNASMSDERGGNIEVGGVKQRTLWRDAAKHAWIVSGGGGKFFNQFFYPMRADFYMPGAAIGAPIAWLPTSTTSTLADFLGDNRAATGNLDDNPKPVKVRYVSNWRSDYPKLKRGETLTYQGGEYFNENPGSNGLPALVAMKAAEIVFDSATPSMVMTAATTAELNKASARIIRPLDRIEFPFTSQKMAAAGFQPGDPASSKVIVVAERWYFKELGGSLQKRFYFDSLQERLVFRGRLNDKEGGDPNLTSGPDPINVLEPAVMTLTEYKNTTENKGLIDLSSNGDWTTAISEIFKKSQNPNGVSEMTANLNTPVFLQGVKSASAVPAGLITEQKTFWNDALTGTVSADVPKLVNLDSYGVGSALVCNPSLLTQSPNGSLYITIAENSRTELDGAPVSLHIVEIVPDRYRGAVKVIEGSDAFSEKITLQHNGEFGANTGDLDYEWWIRDARQLDTTLKNEIDSLATALPDPNWQRYANGPGLHTVIFQGRPDVILADKLVLVRYRHKNETKGWRAVPFELGTGVTPSMAWQPGSSSLTAPYQWAGAANSPQYQADGSKRYIPQLVMGWVKRILDRINPYEARYNDFFSNESPATYSSQIQIAGGPFAGAVALNPDKNVIENVGLIELYRTVLNRAASLSIRNSSNGNSTDGINQALLLAATRLSVLYELLAREAYSDAQDNTINVGGDDTLGGVASFTHAFQNMEADLMQEELSLLRGTDFRKSYPVYNRMFWNYAKGLGEAAYNVNYNISDVTKDGFINEDDARKLYPQGHGDSWGHFLSAIDMHYVMLKEPNFSWKTRSELYSLMQNVLEVDFLDEKTFARLAAGKARAGRDIVRATYRAAYTQDPDGQWQGYTDNADKARAWGVSEWSHRAGQGAYFDWVVANALVPEEPQGENIENLDKLDRLANVDEIGEISGGLHEIQNALDESNSGQNPLGFDSDALAIDIDLFDANSETHFEQIYNRAVDSASIALATLDLATQSQNKLRALGEDAAAIAEEAMSQDLDYRSRLIEIFGTPYTGQIGFGKAYPEGYLGPDTLLYAYLDKNKIDQYVPSKGDANGKYVNFTKLTNNMKGSEIMNNPTMISLYKNTTDGDAEKLEAFSTILADNTQYQFGVELNDLSLPYDVASEYGFKAPATWGKRVSYGSVQTALQDMLAAEMELDTAISDYIAFVRTYERKLEQIQSELERYSEKESIKGHITGVRAGFTTASIVAKTIINALSVITRTSESVGQVVTTTTPTDPVVGLATTVPTAPVEGAAVAATEAVAIISEGTRDTILAGLDILDLIRDEVIARLEQDIDQLDSVREMDGLLVDLEGHLGGERSIRNAIGMAVQNLEVQKQAYFTALAEGFRVLREREAFNKILASRVQKNRYQDMIFRLSRNEAMSKYQTAFNNTARYTWLAARAYDYETSLDPGHPAAPGASLDRIIKERQLGQWVDGAPTGAHGGLAEILTQLKGNFNVLKGQLGINNPQAETEKISMRSELFRISTLDPELEEALALRDDIAAANFPADQLSLEQRLILARLDDPANQEAIAQAGASDDRWKDALKARIVPDLNTMPEFVRHCRPFATGVQPGIVIRFSSSIESGKNFFGLQLAPGDHNYSTANFATKIQSFGVWLDNYNDAGLSTSPRAYLVPVGEDYMRTSSATVPTIRKWSIIEQRIPIPYPINQSNITAPGYIPKMDGIDGAFGELRRHGDFRMYHDNGDPEPDDSETISSNRLVSRSLWNTEWMLIIPGANLHADPNVGLEQLADTIQDIKLYFLTYSHQGQ